ncbi:hypothetical protein, partial [Alistipes shahii]|uniref:hypothetical protein n=1 Tax=Alistipes shahii TaxID=328814 RepID=UPI003AB166D9
GQRNLQGGAKTKCSPPDTEFDAGYFREGEDRLFKAAFFGGRYFSRSARYSSSVIGDGRLWPVRS